MKAIRITILSILSIILLTGCNNAKETNSTTTRNEYTQNDVNYDSKDQAAISKANGLQEIDLFKDISVTYWGTAPEAGLEITNNSKEDLLMNVRYSADIDKGLSNGDTITITAHLTDAHAERSGYFFTANEKQYIVEDADEYITNYYDIDENALTKMDELARNEIENKMNWYKLDTRYVNHIHPNADIHVFDTSDIRKTSELKSINLVGAFLLHKKPEMEYGNHNFVYLVYEVIVTDSYKPEGTTIYMPARFPRLVKKGTGETDLGWINEMNRDVYLYTDYNLMYNDIIIANSELYADTYYYEEIIY